MFFVSALPLLWARIRAITRYEVKTIYDRFDIRLFGGRYTYHRDAPLCLNTLVFFDKWIWFLWTVCASLCHSCRPTAGSWLSGFLGG